MRRNLKGEIERLESQIRLHRYLYYNKHEPRISDQAFDGLMEKLRQLAPGSYVLKETGAPADKDSGWQKTAHSSRMASLANAMDEDEFYAWAKTSRIAGKELVAEDKFDGLTVELCYENGKLVQAITRGDGKVGDDITINASKMKYVKTEIKEKITCSIRGEIMLFTNEFAAVNEAVVKTGKKKYANARNAASGICKRFDGKFSDNLCVVVYDIVTKDISFSYETEKMDYLSKTLDLVTANYKLLTPAGVVKLREQYMESLRDALPYNIDGLVIKINSLQKHKDLGIHGNGDPKGQIAFKFDARGVATTLLDIKPTVGRTGAITPNAVIDPVDIDGSIVKAASIHNYDEIERLGLGIGDEILVIKAGEIIPKITEVITSAGNPTKAPTECPKCGGPVSKRESKSGDEGAILYCDNDECEGREFRRLRHWIEKLKKRMGLEGLGESTIEQMYEAGLVKDPADFYALKESDVSGLDRSGVKGAKKIIRGLTSTKEMDLITFLMGLSIPTLGETMAELITEEYDLYALMEEVGEAELANIQGVGESRAKEIVVGLEAKRPLIEKLMEAGVKIKKQNTDVNRISNKLEGKSFQVTGAITRINPETNKSYKREEWYEVVKSHGGTICRVNKDLNYLLVLRASSNKIKKAESLGTKVISEDAFWEMID